MLKKIVSFIGIIIFILVFSYLEGENFFEHKRSSQKENISYESSQALLSDFSIDSIRDLDDSELFSTPDKELLDDIVERITKAQRRVYLEVYLLTEKRTKKALINAKNRGLEVKVILEHSPYRQTHLNKKAYSELMDKGIDIVWSDPKDYALNHSKLLIIDDELFLSTGNMSYSTFAYNRDFFIHTKDKRMLSVFEQIFLNDYVGSTESFYDHSIVLSPDYSREKFQELFIGARKSIHIYAQYIKDRELFELLKQRANAGINVLIILSKNGYKEYLEKYQDLSSIKVREFSGSTTMHAKAIMIDEKVLFIGSINFSSPSIDKNREMGLIFSNHIILEKFQQIWEKDWKNSIRIDK